MERHADGTWLETQPDDMQYHHKELGHITRGPFHGAIIQRVENPAKEQYPVQLFIPDEGAGDVLLYRSDQGVSWEYAARLNTTTSNCPRAAAGP